MPQTCLGLLSPSGALLPLGLCLVLPSVLGLGLSSVTENLPCTSPWIHSLVMGAGVFLTTYPKDDQVTQFLLFHFFLSKHKALPDIAPRIYELDTI